MLSGCSNSQLQYTFWGQYPSGAILISRNPSFAGLHLKYKHYVIQITNRLRILNDSWFLSWIKMQRFSLTQSKRILLTFVWWKRKRWKPTISKAKAKLYFDEAQPSVYALVLWKLFCLGWNRSAPVYPNFHILCLKVTLKCVGWAVCNICFLSESLLEEGTTRHQPQKSSSSFHRHLQSHSVESEDPTAFVNVPK